MTRAQLEERDYRKMYEAYSSRGRIWGTDLRVMFNVKHLLTEIPKHMDDINQSFLDALSSLAGALPKEFRKN